jgi:F-type H+-transporting ATPase subunit delta
MSYEAIARRYARAIFEIGKETSTLPAVTREVSDFAASYAANDELRDVLGNPLVTEEAREGLLTELASRMGLAQTALSTLKLLGRRRRLAALPEIARQLARMVDEEGGMVRANVTSAGPLTDAYLNDLKATLERSIGKKVTITHTQDPTLIGGLVTQIGDQVIDGSIRARLQSFRESLLRT